MKPVENNTHSAEQRYIVVQRKRHYGLHRALQMSGTFVAGLLLGGLFGYQAIFYGERHIQRDNEQLEAALEQTGDQVESMRGELAVHKHGNEVERQVSENLRQEIVELQNRLHEQEQSIVFYKSILAPEKAQDLAVHTLELTRTPKVGRYTFKLVLVQPIDSPKDVSGTAIITATGLQSGKQKRLEWKIIGNAKPSPAFKFKVFQDIKGELVIPDSFMPESLSVELIRAGSKSGQISEHPWTIKETP